MTKKIFKSIISVSVIVFALGLAFVMGILYRISGTRSRRAEERSFLPGSRSGEEWDRVSGKCYF